MAGRQELVTARNEQGFTMIELIVVMIIVAILAVAVIPRFASRSDFDARGFYDGTLSVLRYAQKSAVAQRRNVCVGFGVATLSLTIASAFGGACDTPLTGPNGVAPYALTAPAGVAFAALPADFVFLSSGAASLGQAFSVSNYPGKTITIVASTGYVQEN
jgi:MSHA pilin protein MshC